MGGIAYFDCEKCAINALCTLLEFGGLVDMVCARLFALCRLLMLLGFFTMTAALMSYTTRIPNLTTVSGGGLGFLLMQALAMAVGSLPG